MTPPGGGGSCSPRGVGRGGGSPSSVGLRGQNRGVHCARGGWDRGGGTGAAPTPGRGGTRWGGGRGAPRESLMPPAPGSGVPAAPRRVSPVLTSPRGSGPGAEPLPGAGGWRGPGCGAGGARRCTAPPPAGRDGGGEPRGGPGRRIPPTGPAAAAGSGPAALRGARPLRPGARGRSAAAGLRTAGESAPGPPTPIPPVPGTGSGQGGSRGRAGGGSPAAPRRAELPPGKHRGFPRPQRPRCRAEPALERGRGDPRASPAVLGARRVPVPAQPRRRQPVLLSRPPPGTSNALPGAGGDPRGRAGDPRALLRAGDRGVVAGGARPRCVAGSGAPSLGTLRDHRGALGRHIPPAGVPRPPRSHG